MTTQSLYLTGDYLLKNPAWHVEESPWKAKQVLRMLRQNNLSPKRICDVGCGAGEVLSQLQRNLNDDCEFWGYDISPQAVSLARIRTNDRLHFKLANLKNEGTSVFDLILALDVMEHIEDCWSFLRQLNTKSNYKIFHIPLDLSVQTVFRPSGLLKRRDLYGHLHYFTKQTALALLKDTGYQVLDYFYTPRSIDLGSERAEKLLNIPRRLLFPLDQDLTVRLFGGFSLLVLAQ